MSSIIIRNEQPKDYLCVEQLIKEAFWNLYVPGCSEHYLAHALRQHEDFIPELDLVLEKDGEIIGQVMYTKAKLVNEMGDSKEILTFGPLAIAKSFQRQGYSRQLLEYSFTKARDMGYAVIVIFGDPHNYVARGFKSSADFAVGLGGGIYPTAMLLKELESGVLAGHEWCYEESKAYEIHEADVARFDQAFPLQLEKQVWPCQEIFHILSQSRIIKS